MNVVIATRELHVLIHRDENVQIARGAAVESRFAFGRDAQSRSVVDARRNLHRDRLLFAQAPGAVARRAWILDHFSRAAALRTRTRNGEESLRVTNLSASRAAAARHRLRSRFRAGAVTRRACDRARNLQRDVFAEHSFFKREREVVAKIVAARRPRRSFARRSEEIAEPEKIAEDVAEIGELIRIESAHSADALMSVAIVARALLLIGQHAVRFRPFLELLLGFRIARIFVAVTLHRELA